MRLRFSPYFCALLLSLNTGVAVAAPTPNDNASSTVSTATGETVTLVNLNTASVTELEKLPGVDSKKARAIIAGRPYTHIDDLQRNHKLSKTEILKIKNLVTIK